MNSTETNLAIVKKLYDAFSRKDINSILGLLHDDVEWGEPENPYNPAAGTRKGHAGFLEWINIGKSAEDILLLNPQRFLTDADSVAVVGNMKCKAIRTQKIYESDFVHFIVIRDQKVWKFQEFFDTYIAGEAFR
ncbi:MAG: nuclear transport factor 2 family protein [Lewinellaceae bacterium]|nr:nuclear transport factor 2 family protein [Lewinellaceae bacterium]